MAPLVAPEPGDELPEPLQEIRAALASLLSAGAFQVRGGSRRDHQGETEEEKHQSLTDNAHDAIPFRRQTGTAGMTAGLASQDPYGARNRWEKRIVL